MFWQRKPQHHHPIASDTLLQMFKFVKCGQMHALKLVSRRYRNIITTYQNILPRTTEPLPRDPSKFQFDQWTPYAISAIFFTCIALLNLNPFVQKLPGGDRPYHTFFVFCSFIFYFLINFCIAYDIRQRLFRIAPIRDYYNFLVFTVPWLKFLLCVNYTFLSLPTLVVCAFVKSNVFVYLNGFQAYYLVFLLQFLVGLGTSFAIDLDAKDSTDPPIFILLIFVPFIHMHLFKF